MCSGGLLALCPTLTLGKIPICGRQEGGDRLQHQSPPPPYRRMRHNMHIELSRQDRRAGAEGVAGRPVEGFVLGS